MGHNWIYLVARAVIIYYGQREPRASVSCVAAWVPEGKIACY